MHRLDICLPALCAVFLFSTAVRAEDSGGGAASHGGAGYGHRFAGISPPSAADPAPGPEAAGEKEVVVKLDDCMDNAPLAGYSFSEGKVVSCEDSTVDMYLSFSDEGGYFFLVPEDTQIKDIGPRNQLKSVRLIKPVDWSANHAASLIAGHVYVVWASTGDLYLVKVDALWEKHAMFGWIWHSHLTREAAEKFLKDNAGGPPGAPYFTR